MEVGGGGRQEGEGVREEGACGEGGGGAEGREEGGEVGERQVRGEGG